MRRTILTVALTCALLVAAAPNANPAALLARDGGDDGVRSVCYPAAPTSGGPKPPCVSLDDIGWQCAPNGTSALALQAHAQCMCGGSYFADYTACQACLLVHGARSPRDNAFYGSVISSVSRVLCGATGAPSAPFQSVFESVVAGGVPQPTTGDTASSDRAPGKTEISVYATVTYSQGPGPITGSATGATDKPVPSASGSGSDTRGAGTGTAPKTTATPGTTTTTSSAGGSAGAATTSSSTSSPNGAAPTAGFRGAVLGMAAGAIVAIL